MSKPQNAPKPEKSDAAPTPPVNDGATEVVKAAPPPAPPAPKVDVAPPAPPELSAEEKAEREAYARIQAKRRELDKLQMEAEEKHLDDKIQALKYPGRSPTQVANLKKQEALRAATHKETLPSGQVICYYRIPEVSFKKGSLQKPGFIMDLPIEKLPGITWQAVKKAPRGPADSFTSID